MKINLLKFFLFFCLFPTTIHAQNICTNGNFDTYTNLPYDYAQTCYATGWLSPSTTCFLIAGTGSPDYYHTSGSGGAQAPNTWWATAMPHSGGGMEGFVTWYGSSSADYREYIARQLSSPLVPGIQYEISCWISNGVSNLHDVGTDNLGFYFSNAVPLQNLGDPIPVIPQAEVTTVLYSTGWQLVTLYYTATAAYNYVTIGNFRNDANTVHTAFGPSGYGCYFFIDDVVIKPSTPLPVELLSFTAEKENKNIVLNWSTASEFNNDYFTIEKSINRNDFSPMATVKGNGTSSQLHQYIFIDEHPTSGISYYRLKQTDFNGEERYSETRNVEYAEPKNEFKIFPNPATGKFALKFYSELNLICNVEIYDLRGRKILTQNYFAPKGNNEIKFNESFKAGNYLLKFNNDSKSYISKLLIQ
jgi:type IX secretion system substrate protein